MGLKHVWIECDIITGARVRGDQVAGLTHPSTGFIIQLLSGREYKIEVETYYPAEGPEGDFFKILYRAAAHASSQSPQVMRLRTDEGGGSNFWWTFGPLTEWPYPAT